MSEIPKRIRRLARKHLYGPMADLLNAAEGQKADRLASIIWQAVQEETATPGRMWCGCICVDGNADCDVHHLTCRYQVLKEAAQTAFENIEGAGFVAEPHADKSGLRYAASRLWAAIHHRPAAPTAEGGK